jgi:hypothetical protein
VQTINQQRSSSARQLRHMPSTEPTILDSSHKRMVQKDADNPNTSIQPGSLSGTGFTYTPASLTKLLGASMVTSTESSRQSSYNQGNANLMRRANMLDGASLPDHLYTRGLLGGRHSDITILAFGNHYDLHRLILDRAPFFTMALSEPWSESKAKEVALHPEQVDSAITQNSFELALKRLYGCDISEEEDAEAVGLFATGCWLEMQELIDSAVESILRQMDPENLDSIITLVTNNCYGRPGERILSSAKAMLCRDGWDMPLKYWDAIPGQIVQEVVSSDGFFVTGEWERWNHAKRLLDRRLKQCAVEAGLINSSTRPRLRAPMSLMSELPRFNPQSSSGSSKRSVSRASITDEAESWYSVYLHPDVESIIYLLDNGIHYIHMEFEHLQHIKQTQDIFGLPVVPDTIVMNALFQQLELRQKVVNAQESDLELGLSHQTGKQEQNLETKTINSVNSRGKSRASEVLSSLSTERPGTASGPPKFWIPSEDCTMVTGGTADPIVSLSSGSGAYNRARSSTEQSDGSWSEIGSSPSVSSRTPGGKTSGEAQTQPTPSSYSTLPPFRFSAEFPAPRMLKEKKRVYSRTVFYAGSYWNIYIQKMRSVTKQNFQLGVYLHRAKDRDQEDFISTGSNIGPTTVDERIGQFEREMIMRGGNRQNTPRYPNARAGMGPNNVEIGNRSSATLFNGSHESTRESIASNMAIYPRTIQDRNAHSRFSDATLQTYISFDTDSDDTDSPEHVDADFGATDEETAEALFGSSPVSLQAPFNSPFVPPRLSTLPPYADTRPTIRTYFKIYSPSKAGRLLSVYESAPDQFDFSQSWGWRSSTLMLDEGFSDEGADDPLAGLAKKNRNGVLRFSVVIGNL